MAAFHCLYDLKDLKILCKSNVVNTYKNRQLNLFLIENNSCFFLFRLKKTMKACIKPDGPVVVMPCLYVNCAIRNTRVELTFLCMQEYIQAQYL